MIRANTIKVNERNKLTKSYIIMTTIMIIIIVYIYAIIFTLRILHLSSIMGQQVDGREFLSSRGRGVWWFWGLNNPHYLRSIRFIPTAPRGHILLYGGKLKKRGVNVNDGFRGQISGQFCVRACLCCS